MLKKIIAFAASNSSQSINKQLVEYTSAQLADTEVILLDLNDFELPVYSLDLEKHAGVPKNAIRFLQFIQEADGIVISLAEHNGLYTSAFKNLWDWISRVGSPKVWHEKPMLLMGTSPSMRAESNVMKVSQHLFPLFGANIITSFHLPSFNHFFKDGKIIEPTQKELFTAAVEKFQNHLTNN